MAEIESTNFKSVTGTFSGDETSSLVECQDFINRFENYKTLKGWTDANAAKAFGFTLRGKASMWYRNFQNRHPTQSANWPDLKKAFQKRFDTTGSPEDQLQGLTDLKLRKGESVVDFADRIEYTHNFLQKEPENTLTDDNEKRIYKSGQEASKEENMKLYFLNGIPEYVKMELLKRPLKERLTDVVDDAKRIENAQK